MARGEGDEGKEKAGPSVNAPGSVSEFLGMDVADSTELFAVTPLESCPHLSQVSPVPDAGIDIGAACASCDNVGENWVCLVCYQVGCGRFLNSHGLAHGTGTGHAMALSLADLSVWCYVCDAYVHHADLVPAKSAAHAAKFGVPMPH